VHTDGSVHVTVCTQHVAIVSDKGCYKDKCSLYGSGCRQNVVGAFCLQPLAHPTAAAASNNTNDGNDDVHCGKNCILCNKQPATVVQASFTC
jgi:hypothetical protein